MAEIFLPLSARRIVNAPLLRRLFMYKLAPTGMNEYVLARTKVFDKVFTQALESDVAQIVLLGAGFDTRALRYAKRNRGTKVFELDVPTTQAPKLDILRRKGVVLPEELVFVSINFNTQSLSEALFRAGYEKGAKSLFLWEGVTMYLTAEAVDATLDFIHDGAAQGSSIAFDYIYTSVLRGENKLYGEKEIFETVSRAGEGWTFGLEQGEVEQFLDERGFRIAVHYTPSELEALFLRAEDGTMFGRVNGTHCIAIASVK